jgi:hypothetical protein
MLKDDLLNLKWAIRRVAARIKYQARLAALREANQLIRERRVRETGTALSPAHVEALRRAGIARRKFTPEQAAERAKAKSRRTALAAYHKRAEEINAKRRADGTKHGLEAAYRRAIKKQTTRQRQELARLHGAALNVVSAFNSRVEQKLKRALRRRFENAVRTAKNKSAWIREHTGIELAGLRLHLEAQFRPGMTWANHAFDGWHIDHRKPLAAFDLTCEAERRQAFHYTNLQPLWAEENFAKRDKALHSGLP